MLDPDGVSIATRNIRTGALAEYHGESPKVGKIDLIDESCSD